MHYVARFWNDDTATVVSAELVFLMTIVGIGMVAGLSAYRDGLVLEFADIGSALGQIDQSYSFAAITGTNYSLAGSTFVDNANFCATQCVEVIDADGTGG